MKTGWVIAMAAGVALISGYAGWQLARREPDTAAPAAAAPTARKPLFYQSAMHPWIKSEKPGRCTICGMELTPVYEGEKGLDVGSGVIALSSNAITVLHVRSAPVQRERLVRTLRVAGVVGDDATRHRVVSAYVAGRIDRLYVNYNGAEVSAGQPLATFFSPQLLAAEREYAALAAHPVESSATAVEHRLLLDAARVRLRQLGLTDEQIAELPHKAPSEWHTELAAPMTGTVVKRMVYEGQYIKDGDPMFEIADFSVMWFVFDGYERDLSWIRAGQAVRVRTPAAPGKTFQGRVAFIDPTLEAATRSAKVRVELANPVVESGGRRRRELYHQLYAEGDVEVDVPEVLAVPRSAVLMPAAEAVVYVDLGQGAFEARRVRLGRAGDQAWEVLEGLDGGERVVVSGNLMIDAQAQLNASLAETTPPSGRPRSQPEHRHAAASGAARPALSVAQQPAAAALLGHLDALGGALAADDLDAFNRAVQQHSVTLDAFLAAFPPGAAWGDWSVGLGTNRVAQAASIEQARRSFLGFMTAALPLVSALRTQEAAFAEWRIYRCPMVDQAWRGAPKTAEWVQRAAPLRNPWFGARMLDCGVEVTPRPAAGREAGAAGRTP